MKFSYVSYVRTQWLTNVYEQLFIYYINKPQYLTRLGLAVILYLRTLFTLWILILLTKCMCVINVL